MSGAKLRLLIFGAVCIIGVILMIVGSMLEKEVITSIGASMFIIGFLLMGGSAIIDLGNRIESLEEIVTGMSNMRGMIT